MRSADAPLLPGEIMDEATKRLLVKKIWCHGQAIAPFQGLACAYWAVKEPGAPFAQIALLWAAALILPVWSAVSWKAMHGRSLNYWKLICYFGIIIEVIHSAVVVVAAKQGLGESLHLLCFIFSGLHIIETAAYLGVTTCLRESFVKDTSEKQMGLLWDDADGKV